MWLSLIILFSLLAIIYFLSVKIQRLFSLFFFLIIRNQKIAYALLAIILLPGTIIHELSHLIIALILRVPTGELRIMPTIESPAASGPTTIIAGSLSLGKTDPFRRILVGLAPIFVGLTLIYLLNYQLLSINRLTILPLVIIYYLLFSVSINMFSSRKDLESIVIAGPITIIIVYLLYVLGVRISLSQNLLETLSPFVTRLNVAFGRVGVLDLFTYLFLRIVIYFLRLVTEKLTKT